MTRIVLKCDPPEDIAKFSFPQLLRVVALAIDLGEVHVELVDDEDGVVPVPVPRYGPAVKR